MNRWVRSVAVCVMPLWLWSCIFGNKARAQVVVSADTVVSAKDGLVGGQDTARKNDATTLAQGKQATPVAVAGSIAVATRDTVVKPGEMTTGGKQYIDLGNEYLTQGQGYKSFDGRAKIKYEGPDNTQDFTANFRVAKDSLIWINIVAVGIPAARILITPDSFYLINYLAEEVTFRPLSELEKMLPSRIDFTSLQNMLVGAPFRKGLITDARVDTGTLDLQLQDTGYVQSVCYRIADTTLCHTEITTRKPGGPVAASDYTNYQAVTGGRVAMTRALKMTNNNKTYHVSLQIEKMEFDKPIDFPFKIPGDYTVK